ncbi:hypothetical protein niasHT_036463 [Heterodera trifolii]|uniref:Nuclear receptor domain-containing protein n=1 Tax=Heterodera trifolii TaxID=157864 RepID=A0ABD2IXQ4_9BILA
MRTASYTTDMVMCLVNGMRFVLLGPNASIAHHMCLLPLNKKNKVKCRGCRLDKCLVAGLDPTMINVPHSDKFKQFLANLKKRKMSAMLNSINKNSVN